MNMATGDKSTNGAKTMIFATEGVEACAPVKDADGKTQTMKYLPDMVGYKYLAPVFSAEVVLNIPKLLLRDDDIIIASYPRSGCHWLWDIVRMLQQGKLVLDNEKKESFMMEYASQEEIDQLSSPRILNHHQHFGGQPHDVFKKKTKTILMYRNIKDTLTSLWHFQKRRYNGDFQQFLPRTLDGLVTFGNPMDYLLSWEKGLQEHPELPVLIVSYDDLKVEPLPVLKKIVEFIGGKRKDEDFLKSVVEATDINKMRDRKLTAANDDSMSLNMVQAMYRKGVSGDWKNLFTVAQDEWISKIIEKRLKDTRFKVVLE